MAHNHVKRHDSIGSAGNLAALSSTPSPLMVTPTLATPLYPPSQPPLVSNRRYYQKACSVVPTYARSMRWSARTGERAGRAGVTPNSSLATPTSGCSMASRPSVGCTMGSTTTASSATSVARGNHRRPLASKHIYLDLAPAAHKSMEAKLYMLGANIEKCLSRDANYMITDQGHANDYKSNANNNNNGNHSNGNGSAASNPAARGYSGATRRPLKCLSQSHPSPNIPPSSTPAHSPASQSTISPLSRGQAIANLVNTAKYHSGGSAVVNAQRMGIKIIHYDTAMIYVKKELDKLSRLPHAVNSQPSSKQNNITAKKLPTPVCKITSKHYQPIIISAKYFSLSNKPSYNQTMAKHKSKQGKIMNNYCELCNDEFTILSKHLKGDKHSSKVNQPNHFTELDAALNSCGTLSDLLNSLS